MNNNSRNALEASLYTALARVEDPEIRKPLTDLDMVQVRSVSAAGEAEIDLLLTIAGCPAAKKIASDVQHAALSVPGITGVKVAVSVMTAKQRQELINRIKPERKNQFGKDTLTRIIAVTSGKGGVGKSSLTTALALQLSALGHSVGVIDADIFGFSIPDLIGFKNSDATPTRVGDMILPPTINGIRVISIGMFLDTSGSPTGTAVSWRGPMLHRTLEQFLTDVYFGDLDYLLLDLPPGTGDIAISMGQLLPHAEIIVVTTPGTNASDVAVRSGLLAHQSGQKILGVVENMSFMQLADGSTVELFGNGGAAAVAAGLEAAIKEQAAAAAPEVPVLAQIPFSLNYREALDSGSLNAMPGHDLALAAVTELATKISKKGRDLAGRALPISF